MEIANSTFQYMVLAIVLLAVLNVVTIGISFGMGIGKRVVQRLKQRWLYKKGNHVNSIFIRRNHVSHELFVKKEPDGSFKVNDQIYSVNPLATFVHDGIPTQINMEGDAEAFNIFNDPKARSMSTAELENIIMSNENDGTAAYIKKMMFWLLIILGLCLIAAGVAAYYGFSLHDYIIKKKLVEQGVVAAQEAIRQASLNMTGVMPR